MTVRIDANVNVYNTTAATGVANDKAKTGSVYAGEKPLGADDTVDVNPKMPKLTKGTYEIKDGDSLMKIANKLGLKVTDLVDQLIDAGKLPKDYDPFARHQHDISWMKAGKTIDVSYPKTEEQKAAYEEFTTARTRAYANRKAAAEKAAKAAEENSKKDEGFLSRWFGL